MEPAFVYGGRHSIFEATNLDYFSLRRMSPNDRLYTIMNTLRTICLDEKTVQLRIMLLLLYTDVTNIISECPSFKELRTR